MLVWPLTGFISEEDGVHLEKQPEHRFWCGTLRLCGMLHPENGDSQSIAAGSKNRKSVWCAGRGNHPLAVTGL